MSLSRPGPVLSLKTRQVHDKTLRCWACLFLEENTRRSAHEGRGPGTAPPVSREDTWEKPPAQRPKSTLPGETEPTGAQQGSRSRCPPRQAGRQGGSCAEGRGTAAAQSVPRKREPPACGGVAFAFLLQREQREPMSADSEELRFMYLQQLPISSHVRHMR